MHAIQLHVFGPPENLRFESAPEPVAANGHVRIHVEAAGVHVIDTRLRAGEVGPFPLPDLPSIPGREVAGRLDTGERVVAHLGRAAHLGGHAEIALAPVAAVHRVPDHISAAEAVTAIGTGRTALLMLDQVRRITAADVVLVKGAAGGIGNLLVQAARNAGATVHGTANPRKHDVLRSLGVSVEEVEPTLVLDTTTPPMLPPPTPEEQRALEIRALNRVWSGAWRALVTCFPLADAAGAHRAIEERTAIGKVVLVP